MTKNLISNNLYDIRKKIEQLKYDLNELGDPVIFLPEMIASSNLLRSNEFLLKSNNIQNELLSLYDVYSESMNELLSSVFEIQDDLKSILIEQSSLIDSKPKTKPLPRL